MNLFQSVWKATAAATTAATSAISSLRREEPKVEASIGEGDLKVQESGVGVSSASSPNVDDQTRKSTLLRLLSSKLGMDIASGLSLPISYCEPLTSLQRMAEPLEYAYLLNEAAVQKTSMERMAYVAVFIVSGFSNTERYGKPLNPLLGETFALEDSKNHFKFFAEQTSHHPPIGASHTRGQHFEMWQQTEVSTKFLGNSVDCYFKGGAHVSFNASGDHFTYSPPTTRMNNIILGRMWIDHFGNVELQNIRTGDRGTLKFVRCGWLGKGRYEVNGLLYDSKGLCCVRVTGKWNEGCKAEWVSSTARQTYMDRQDEEAGILNPTTNLLDGEAAGPPSTTAVVTPAALQDYKNENDTFLLDMKDVEDPLAQALQLSVADQAPADPNGAGLPAVGNRTTTTTTTTTCNGDLEEEIMEDSGVGNVPELGDLIDVPLVICSWNLRQDNFVGSYRFTRFAESLNKVENGDLKLLVSTDSRRRPDRAALEVGDMEKAAFWKASLEENQRADKRRNLQENQNEFKWNPVWFKGIPSPSGDRTWVYFGDYWEKRDDAERRLAEGEDSLDLLRVPCVDNLACNYSRYNYIPRTTFSAT